MSKPVDLPRWATDETNNTEPVDAQKDTGWTNNQVIVSSYFNWLFKLIYDWISYLSDGALEGNVHIDGTLEVTGSITGDAGGVALLESGIETTEVFYTTPQVFLVDAGLAHPTATHTVSVGQIVLAASTNKIYLPLTELNVGDHITRFRARRVKGTDDTDELFFRIVRIVDTVITAVSDDIDDDANATGVGFVEAVAQDVEILAGGTYWVEIEPGGSVAPAANRVYHMEIYRTHPVP